MNKSTVIIIFLLVILLAIVGLITKDFFFNPDNNYWACEDGVWVKHGWPSQAQPASDCGNATSTEPVVEQPNISLFNPTDNQTVSLPIQVSGQAREFENQVAIRLKSSAGEILYQDFALARSADVGLFGPFEKSIGYLTKKPVDNKLFLEVYANSAKDGSEIDLVSVPLKLSENNTSTIKLFFSNNILDPENTCAKVFPVERLIAKTEAPARAALELLLAGPTPQEQQLSFATNINSGVKINSLTIEAGVAKADFSQEFSKEMGGSCRVSAIRAQIEQTMKQFATVKRVVISVDGETEGVLQP